MSFTSRSSRKRLTRGLVFEQVEQRRLMAADVAAMQPAAEMTDEAQFMIELINRARANPTAEAQRLGVDLNQGLSAGAITNSPKQPLVPNQHLIDAALAHSADMIANDYFSHTGLDGSSPSTRVREAGYSTGAAENIAFNYLGQRDLATVINESHEMLFRSAGHRQNLMSDFMGDIGIGSAIGDRTYEGHVFSAVMTTQTFGRESNTPSSLTGVIYTDAGVVDNFYTPGEGIAGVTIEAVSASGARYSTVSGTSGGYALELPAGKYSVRAFNSTAKTVAVLGDIEIAKVNVKIDLLPGQFTAAGETEIGLPVTPSTPSVALGCDVNGDGIVSANDALTVINHLNNPEAPYVRRVDVNGDDAITSLDALVIINHMNTTTTTANETVASEEMILAAPITTSDPRLTELVDLAEQDVQKRFPMDRELVVESAKAVTWSDSSLDLAKTVMAKESTPGYQIVLRYGTMLMEYRAAATGPLKLAGWEYIADYLVDEDGFCCPWDIDAPCFEAIHKALDAVTVDYIHSSQV